MKSDRVASTPQFEPVQIADPASTSMPGMAEIEAALGLALLQAGCTEGKQGDCISQLLDELAPTEAKTVAEMGELDEDKLMTKIVERNRKRRASR